ncbi:MAG: biotin-dependent carboxyltransferase family protein [Anaerolineae bacterium]|nr:biotin-dependent carboxyltransferase family protein [Anaerolineae bacterium]
MADTVLHIIEPGLLTTVQDSGRPGWARYGIPASGPMDRDAYHAANALVRNAPHAGALEITLTGPDIVISDDCLVAVCGAEFELFAGSLPVPTWHAVYLRRGDHFRFGMRHRGARAIVAVSGGIDVPLFLGSRSTFLNGGFGGYHGRALQRGDQLLVGKNENKDLVMAAGSSWAHNKRPRYSASPVIRVVLGPQADYFDPPVVALFSQHTYTISAASNRMGFRLAGPALVHKGATGIVSDGIVTGSIQVPPDGQPIVMMVDHQTTGGYPKIATVVQADIPLLAQCLPGDSIQFRVISVDEAYRMFTCRV